MQSDFLKRCCRCEQELPSSDFGKQAAAKDGLSYACRRCIRLQTAARAERNREAGKRWYAANREHRLETGKRWVENNRERRLAQQKAYRESNPEKVKASVQRCVDANPEKYKARVKRWAQDNPELCRARTRRYREAHPEAVAADRQNRRARLEGADGSHSALDIAALVELQRGQCAHAWCRKSIRRKRHVDHILPLALGGSNRRTNLQLLCPTCNLKKHAKHPIDFAQENGMLL